jgi:peroxiredoxin
MPTGAWLYSYLALWFLLALECLALVLVLRQVARLHSYWLRNDPDWGLPLGSLAPALPPKDLYGRNLSLAAARGRKTVLFFLTPGCRGCEHAMSLVGTTTNPDDAEVVLVVRGSAVKVKLFVSRHGREARFPEVPVVADPEGTVSERYKVVVAPYTVVLDTARRVVAKGSAITDGDMWLLMSQADRIDAQVGCQQAEWIPAFSAGDAAPGGP